MAATSAAPIRIISTLAFRGVLDELAPVYETQNGHTLNLSYDPTALILGRIKAGEQADIALLTERGVADMCAAGILAPASATAIAVSEVGLAVKAGAPKPDISTVDAVRAALLNATSVAYSRAGASGIFFAGLLERLGIATEVNARAHIIASGFSAELAADGRAALAVQQVSELMTVPGVDIVGPLPDALQERLTFSGGVLASAPDPSQARAVLAFLTDPALAAVYRKNGLIPLSRAAGAEARKTV